MCIILYTQPEYLPPNWCILVQVWLLRENPRVAIGENFQEEIIYNKLGGKQKSAFVPATLEFMISSVYSSYYI